jgi:hypothetical protein
MRHKVVWGVVGLAAVLLVEARATRAANVEAPPGYQLVNVTPLGRSFATQKPGVASVQQALQSTLRDLARYFGARPIVRKAYEDTRDRHSGGAAFFVTTGGVPVKGLVFCKVGPRGASVAVVSARADASAAEWRRLMTSPARAATPANAQPQAVAPAASAEPGGMRVYSFSDGTGTISLPPGWQADLESCAWGAVARGPAGQRVVLATSTPVYTPGSAFARQQRASGAPIVIGPFIAPADALRTLAPQLSRMAASNHLPSFVLDNVAEKQSLTPMFPGGRSAMVTYGATESGPRGRQHYKTLAQIDLAPPSNGFWMLRFSAEMRAPDSIFDRELPVMLAIAKGWHGDDAAMARRINGQTAAKQRWFQTQQRRQREKSAQFDRYIAGQEADSNARLAASDAATQASNDRLRQANDFDEVIRGYRTVEDTQTGQRTSVDLGDVDKIVDKLNERDPDRYKQIPLRDEAEGK